MAPRFRIGGVARRAQNADIQQVMRWMVLTVGLALAANACQSASCNEGLMLVDGNCIPPGGNCGACGEHEFCDVTVVPDNQCRCAPGYEGNPCVFVGLIRNPDFTDEGGDHWFEEVRKGADIDRLAVGFEEGDRGVATLPGSALCAAGSLTQVVTMPSHDAAQELHVVEAIYRADEVHGLAVGFGRVWRRLPATGPDWVPAPETFCLGEGAYGDGPDGSDVYVRFSASEQSIDCSKASVQMSRFDIRPAEEGECLEFGQVLNGDVLPSAGGWRFDKDDGIDAAIVPGAGIEGASGARLRREVSSGGRATMTTKMSVPLPDGDQAPALRFWWEGSPQQRFEVELGTFADFDRDDRGRQLATLVGTGSGLHHIYCLPPWTHGNVLDLSFSLTEGEPTKSSQLVVDEVEIISDANCGTNSELLDPGFDYAPNLWSGTALGSSSEEVNLIDDGGNGVLELAYWTTQGSPGMETYVLVPDSDENAGPALTFLSMAPKPLSSDVEWLFGRSESLSDNIKTLDEWKPNEVCLPPAWAGRWFRVQVRARPTSSEATPIEREAVWLDDFSLGPSPSCPTD